MLPISHWPFEDPPNVAAFTTKRVVLDRRPIVRVTHDADDGAWQFHSDDVWRTEDAMLVALSKIVELDPSIRELADLPRGWDAVRTSPSNPWTRHKIAGEEIFDVVNDRDEVIDRRPRSEVHRLGLLHRAVHVLVFNSRVEIFLQKRSMKKDRQPGLWDSSASGHLDSGEEYDACAVRELNEEIGLKLSRPPERLFRIHASPETDQEFVWVYRCEAEGPFALNPDEIERGGWFGPQEVKRWIAERPEEFASAFVFIWKKLLITDGHG
jgi:isopentenyldiphosphate isomerase